MTVRTPLALITTLVCVGLFASAGAQEQPTKRPTDEVRGEELYKRHCVACHGAAGLGDGPATKALVRPVPNLRGQVKADEATITLLMRGRGAMPGYEQTFDRFDAKKTLEHMAKLPPPAAPAPAPTDEAKDQAPVVNGPTPTEPPAPPTPPAPQTPPK